MMSVKRTSSLILAAGLMLAAPGLAQESGKPDEAAMMQEWARWATPGDAHKPLAQLVGKWNATVRMWADPSAPPSESPGTAEFTSILGGRWVSEKFSGTFMGMPFEGFGLTGYDNFRKTYVNMWVDNSSTAMMTGTGSLSADGKTYDISGLMDEPMTGQKDKKYRETLTWTGPDQFVMKMFDTSPGKGEVLVMEITHNRTK